jgi:branched-subunit amino acid transport protein|tara:strand:- start:161 stop:487 length:327 start_codon:yes stop_codon:yes gene_type:complete
MTANTIYTAIFIATCATYLCRAMGVFSAKNINTDSPVFNWIKCVSIGIISAVIAKIILFPVGILSETESESRVIATLVTLLVYFLFKKNVIFGIFAGVVTFLLINFYF